MKHSFIIILLLISGLYHVDVFAADPPAPGDACKNETFARPAGNNGDFEIGNCAGGTFQPYEITSKIVGCIERTIRIVVFEMMNVISAEFGWVTALLGTLVIIFFGIRVAMGEQDALKRGATLSLKIALVGIFMNMLPTLIVWVYAVLDNLIVLVAGGSPWQRIDQFIGKMIGFGPSVTLLNGLLGIVGAAIFSSTVGLTMFFFGIIGILNVLLFILKIIYTYCLAVLTIGFLLTLMPIVIPLGIFFYTERYLEKWSHIVVSAMLTPILLFAFVWMFIGIFDVIILNVFNILGGDDFKAYWRLNDSMFAWMMPSDPNTNVKMTILPETEDVPCVKRGIAPPVQSNINPFVSSSFNAGIGRFATLNFGSNDVNIVQSIGFSFFVLWIFASLMKSMVELIPQIASSMARVSTNLAFGGGSQAIGKLEGGVNNMQSTVKNLGKSAGQMQQGLGHAQSFGQSIGTMLGKR